MADRVTQREKMRELFRRHRGDHTRIVREYATAERRGEVARRRNTLDLSPEDYAARLLNDGLHKGWIT
jgi:hypothetical protein